MRELKWIAWLIEKTTELLVGNRYCVQNAKWEAAKEAGREEGSYESADVVFGRSGKGGTSSWDGKELVEDDRNGLLSCRLQKTRSRGRITDESLKYIFGFPPSVCMCCWESSSEVLEPRTFWARTVGSARRRGWKQESENMEEIINHRNVKTLFVASIMFVTCKVSLKYTLSVDNADQCLCE